MRRGGGGGGGATVPILETASFAMIMSSETRMCAGEEALFSVLRKTCGSGVSACSTWTSHSGMEICTAPCCIRQSRRSWAAWRTHMIVLRGSLVVWVNAPCELNSLEALQGDTGLCRVTAPSVEAIHGAMMQGEGRGGGDNLTREDVCKADFGTLAG